MKPDVLVQQSDEDLVCRCFVEHLVDSVSYSLQDMELRMPSVFVFKHRLLTALALITIASFKSNISYTKISMQNMVTVEIVDVPSSKTPKRAASSMKRNTSYPILDVDPIPNPSSPMPISSFSPWIQEYIEFHQSSIVNGKLKDNARYLIYQCKDGNIRCGGAGDRMMAIVKTLYLSICTRRVFLIDSTFPVPLASVLNAAHIQWNATYPETDEVFDDLGINAPLSMRPGVLGYRIIRTNGNIPQIKKSVNDIWNKLVRGKYLDEKIGESGNIDWSALAERKSLDEVIHEAFWALFTFDKVVVARAQELKISAGLVDPYVGLHMRTGDEHLGLDVERKMERATSNENLLTCYHLLQNKYKFQSAYLASDNVNAKEEISMRESTINYAKETSPFHIDLLARNEKGKLAKVQTTDVTVLQGTIDAWAEILILAESKFLIVSRSMFSFAAHYTRNPKSCSVYLDQCVLRSTGQGSIVYYGEVNVGDLSLITDQRCIQ